MTAKTSKRQTQLPPPSSSVVVTKPTTASKKIDTTTTTTITKTTTITTTTTNTTTTTQLPSGTYIASLYSLIQFQIRINSHRVVMSDNISRYDGHRFDDVFYAYTQMFLHRNFVDVCWSNQFYETNFYQVSAFPIEIVRSYAERLLRVHGSGPLLHTIIAANLECEPMPSNYGRFAFIVHNTDIKYTFKKDTLGLIILCGVDKQSAIDSEYICIRCETPIRISGLNTYESLRQHVRDCDMIIDARYLKPLTVFCKKSDHELYTNFLHKSVAQTTLTRLGILIARPKRFDELPSSAFVNNRFDSLQTVFQSRGKRLRLDDETIYKIGQSGYHTLHDQKFLTWRELKKSLKEFACTTVTNKITCFCCHHEVSMSSKFFNDPWRYHAMKSPSCIFLLMKMGREYIKQVHETRYDFRLRSKMELPTAVIDPKWDLKPTTTPIGGLFDLFKEVTEQKKTELRVALSSTTVSSCSVCCSELRTVALMSCLHIATCVDCSFAIRECPLCRMLITGYMMPVFQPDGSFWKQPDCIGGNYFMNLPCGHLIESCVPNNVNQCPRADAVEEDEIYCVVCGNSKLGKLKVYI